MALVELRLLAPEETAEALCDWLDRAGALSVSVEDADALTPAEQPLFGEPGMPAPRAAWAQSRVVAMFASKDIAMIAERALANADIWSKVRSLGLVDVPEQDWVRLTQSQFEPIEITEAFWIVPSWHSVPPQARVALQVDPGLAFGTGTHATTRMCLRWLATQGQQRALGRMLDYGCGSGILAMAAARFGAEPVDAVDIDDAAVATSARNALANGVQLNVGLPDMARGGYQTVVANILASPLKVLAPLLCSHVQAGGGLILSGILARQADEIRAAYAPWMVVDVADEDEGWILMTGSRPAAM